MRRWILTALAVLAGFFGSAQFSSAASSRLDSAARVNDHAQRLRTPQATVSPEQQLIDEMISLVNAERARHGLHGFRVDARVAAAAQAHSVDMAAHNQMSHTGSDGSDGGQRLDRQGFDWWRWGENVGAGFHDAKTLLDAWMKSPGHRANILDEFDVVGVGIATSSNGSPYWTLLLAS